ncbi:MAG: DUF4372 domain-containing protein, partial [Endozoicomonas sp.]
MICGKIAVFETAISQNKKDKHEISNRVFQQLLKATPRHQFQKVVDRHNGDHPTV